ncbi:TonB-dependent receptor [Pseudoalteromonas sp. MMG010]|uniref:TonB-dependent receptor plug domain-containing protein n=1 Tax=Pseudoalteromonas sp. MMG010 TaxID=2822685 RepID=UPI001B39E679|nr:TonB-dependent receptor [Pseudoalteromonas sp. MMG010]MBQ4832973.1 TonB-dependent receptor [Pseudoalteromonas sp. MMG010]
MLKDKPLSRAIKTALMACSISSVTFSSAYAAQSESEEGEAIEQIVVTGSRGAPRSVADSPVPVDVFSEDDLSSVPFSDTNDVLKTLVPSYSLQRQPISDGASFIRPASLRGMPTDKTLVLVNSKRRHRSALVQIGGSGTQGPDIATIPSSALKGVEVLRDGAAAQYGSDAIAGVINFVLKDNTEGGSISVNTGQYYEGDGEQFTVTGNVGLPLGDKGFISISGEYADSNSTSRSEQYCESWACVDANDPDFLTGLDTSLSGYSEEAFIAGLADANLNGESVVQPWGQPNTSAARLFFNAGYEINQDMKFYAFGNYSKSEGDGGFYYRYPGNGTIEDIRQEDGSLYSPLEEFPGGFTPRFFGDITDISLVTGIEGVFANEMTYDFSGRFGSNKIEYTLKNTINPSLGADSPTSFSPGDLINEELQLSADFTKYVDMGLNADVLLAFGATYMEESYEIVAGDEASYTPGSYASPDPWGFCDGDTASAAGLAVIANGSSLDCADSSDPVYTAVGVGSNGFPGYSPEYSGTYERDMFGVYFDASTDLTDALFIQGAVRYEDYSDFGDELVGKVAFKYALSEDFNLRGSMGTGFRAPTPGQQGTTNVSTRLPDGLPVATGLFPASSPVGEALGAEALSPEKSVNYSLGVTGSVDQLTLTFDYYSIELEDRFYAVSTKEVSTDPTSGDAYTNYLALEAAGVEGANTIGGVNYFQNAFDTTTQGFDFVATYNLGDTLLTGSVNYNKTEIDSSKTDVSEYLNDEDQFDLENAIPKWRGVLSAKHNFDAFSILVRGNIYGSYENAIDSSAINIQKYDPSILVDLELSYAVNEALNLSVGARNIFDTYPDEDGVYTDDGDLTKDDCCGNVYWSSNIVDWQGGYYYARLNYTF